MNVISYSLFKDCPDWLYPFYEKGVDYNTRMAKLIFHGWTVSCLEPKERPRCESMLWRLKPIYMEGIERVICRDLDAILTYRDYQSVQRWINSGAAAHGMNDNPAHGGMKLMGGMCGFKAKEFKEKFPSWESLIEGYDLSQHGSDQKLLNEKVYPAFQNSFYFDQHPQHYPFTGLAESDLTCRHIGSAGVVTMELERFLHKYEKQ